ncbi:unnamed protein product [Lathyrus oleraceus]|uniref:Embryo defective 2759 n=1 Tax=Pisum sativum TaxID=3888 RepID=A0A9D5AIR1_PEA|nr:uncharacterized protein LOC127083654 [Pisum sativum]KAI5407120.1 hypothetical protein KIW84_053394 [Pisum sativum]
MAFVAHQPQGLYVTPSTRHLSWSKRLKLKQCLTKHHMIGRTSWHHLSKHNVCLSVGPPCFCVSKIKPLRISGFKGISHNDDSRTRASWLKAPKTSVGLEESGETHNVPFSYASEAGDSLAASSASHGLFNKWLKMLRTQSSCQEVEGIFGRLFPTDSPETLQRTHSKERSEVFKVAWSHFLALDAAIKIPLLIFVPLYLAVNVKYGAEVSKELTPLWVFGPLIVATHIMIIRGLCALYALSFNQTVKVLRKVPSWCILVNNYVFGGGIKEHIAVYLLRPIASLKDVDYVQLTRRILKVLQEWLRDKYLDFVELIWPHYCRMIRFLKSSKLI